MIEREAAVRAVEELLERDYQQWRAVSADAVRMAVVRVEEHELVWIVSWQSEEFVRTRDSKYALIGNGPYLVDRVDGGLHQIGVVSAVTGEWEADYRARIRGLPVRTAVDDLHDALRGVAAARGRMHAVWTAPRAGARASRRLRPCAMPIAAPHCGVASRQAPTRAAGGGLTCGAMDTELTHDEHLSALAALEAIVGNSDALKVLAGSARERPLPALLAAYGQHTLHRILVAAFGIDATMDCDETGRLVAEINSDPMARIALPLTDALHNQAALASKGLITAKLIGGAILGAIHAFTDADNHDALTLLLG